MSQVRVQKLGVPFFFTFRVYSLGVQSRIQVVISMKNKNKTQLARIFMQHTPPVVDRRARRAPLLYSALDR